VEGLTAPLGMAVPDDGSRRMFVYDQAGFVWVVTEAAGKLRAPLLDVSGRLVPQGNYDERGLLGLAVHPNFEQLPFVYTYTSEPIDGPADFVNVMPEGVTNNHQSVIAEWQIDPADPNRVDPNSRRELLRIDEPQANHNGGTLRFGPDGYLYVSLGDGGRANDVADGHVPGGNAQNLQRIYGKVLRIDVDANDSANGQYGIPQDNPFVGQDAVQEIYAYGLRNPFTYSFDRLTGDLYLGDAGQNNIEEVDIIVSGGNYGWNIKEGSFWFDSVTANIGDVVTGPVRPVPPDLIDPVAEYDHDEGSVVIGGFVYRGSQIPGLEDRYVFGDWGSFGTPSARLFTLDPNLVITELRIGPEDRPMGFWLRGFGEDADGELYVFGSTVLGPSGDTGRMLKIVPSLPLAAVKED
jgi:glucose/arabinose dehydrogenase